MDTEGFAWTSLAQARRRRSAKWRAFGPDVLPLWVAEMDTPVVPAVRAEIERALALGDTGYAFGPEYAEAFAEFAVRRWGWHGVEPSRTVVVADVMNGVVEALKLVTRPGAPVIVTTPVYPPFFSFVAHMGRKVVTVPLRADGRLALGDLGEAFAAAGDGAAFLLCNPHNPTGVAHTPAELAEVARLAGQAGVRVVCDEIHAPLVLPGATFTPYLSVPGAGSAFSLVSASKGWNLAGLKAALLIAGPDAVDDLARLPEEVTHGPSHFGVLAHAAALRGGGEWLDELLAALDANRRLLSELFADQVPDLAWRAPEATFLAWLDCRGLGLRDDDRGLEPGTVMTLAGPAADFVERGRVAFSAGVAFGAVGTGHVRLNFATSPQVLTEAVKRMAATVSAASAG